MSIPYCVTLMPLGAPAAPLRAPGCFSAGVGVVLYDQDPCAGPLWLRGAASLRLLLPVIVGRSDAARRRGYDG